MPKDRCRKTEIVPRICRVRRGLVTWADLCNCPKRRNELKKRKDLVECIG